jgi:hypothetical protein
MKAKIPNFNIQAPEKLQDPMFKRHQKSNDEWPMVGAVGAHGFRNPPHPTTFQSGAEAHALHALPRLPNHKRCLFPPFSRFPVQNPICVHRCPSVVKKVKRSLSCFLPRRFLSSSGLTNFYG